MRRFYVVTRDLHLYLGLFTSPFVLVFAFSVFYLTHPITFGQNAGEPSSRVVENVIVAPEVAGLQGRARVEALKPVLSALGVGGEVDYVRHVTNEHRLVIPIKVPGRSTTVDLDYEAQTATITTRSETVAEALVYLHKMPGPHNADLRGNAGFMRLWRVLADATVYTFLFITISGLYLWFALRAERTVGAVLLAAGLVTFAGLVYVIAR